MINPPRERRIVFRAYLDTVEYVYADISIIGRGAGALTGIVSHLLYTARHYAALVFSLLAERRRRVVSRVIETPIFLERILRSTRVFFSFFRREFFPRRRR